MSVTLRENYQYVHKGKMWEFQDCVTLYSSIFPIAQDPKQRIYQALFSISGGTATH